jgi:hypothetical protein
MPRGYRKRWNPDSSKEDLTRRHAVVLALAAALALVPAQAASADILDLSAGVFPDDQLAALSSSGDPFAVGGGTAETVHFAFSAHLGPNGPSGYAVVSDPALGEAQGNVVCFNEIVPGQQVVFFIEKQKGSGFFGAQPFLAILAADFGKSPVGDFFDARPATLPPPTCNFDNISRPVTQGNIVVK